MTLTSCGAGILPASGDTDVVPVSWLCDSGILVVVQASCLRPEPGWPWTRGGLTSS